MREDCGLVQLGTNDVPRLEQFEEIIKKWTQGGRRSNKQLSWLTVRKREGWSTTSSTTELARQTGLEE